MRQNVHQRAKQKVRCLSLGLVQNVIIKDAIVGARLILLITEHVILLESKIITYIDTSFLNLVINFELNLKHRWLSRSYSMPKILIFDKKCHFRSRVFPLSNSK